MAGPLQITVPAGSFEDLGSQDPQDVIEQLMQMRRDAGAPDQTHAEVVDWRFPVKGEKFTTVGFDPERDAEMDEMIADQIALQETRQGAPHGSPQETINTRFPVMGWSRKAEITPSMDAIPETDDETYRGQDMIALQHFWRNLPSMTNEAGAKAWMEDPNPAGGFSGNIDDRRGQSTLETALGMMQNMMPGDEDLSSLSPQDYINYVIGGMHNNDFYYGPGAENYHLMPGVSPTDYDQADFYPTRKISR